MKKNTISEDVATRFILNQIRNKQLLKEVVHRKELDLAVVFMIVLESKENDDLSGTILIRRELVDL